MVVSFSLNVLPSFLSSSSYYTNMFILYSSLETSAFNVKLLTQCAQWSQFVLGIFVWTSDLRKKLEPFKIDIHDCDRHQAALLQIL